MDEMMNEGAAMVLPSKQVSVIKPDTWLQIKVLHQ
jgi:hypothetical protein